MPVLNEKYMWIIQSQYYYLDKYCLSVGLGRDSATPIDYASLPNKFVDANLVFPSAKCPAPEPWLKVLALLHVHNVSYKLFQATGGVDNYTSLTLLQPSVNEELKAMLGKVAQKKIEELKYYKELLDHAFHLLQS